MLKFLVSESVGNLTAPSCQGSYVDVNATDWPAWKLVTTTVPGDNVWLCLEHATSCLSHPSIHLPPCCWIQISKNSNKRTLTCQIIRRLSNDWIGLSSVLRPRQHSTGYMGDGFYKSKDPTNSIKVLKEHVKWLPYWPKYHIVKFTILVGKFIYEAMVSCTWFSELWRHIMLYTAMQTQNVYLILTSRRKCQERERE